MKKKTKMTALALVKRALKTVEKMDLIHLFAKQQRLEKHATHLVWDLVDAIDLLSK